VTKFEEWSCILRLQKPFSSRCFPYTSDQKIVSFISGFNVAAEVFPGISPIPHPSQSGEISSKSSMINPYELFLVSPLLHFKIFIADKEVVTFFAFSMIQGSKGVPR
jgi:hypothetical protein